MTDGFGIEGAGLMRTSGAKLREKAAGQEFDPAAAGQISSTSTFNDRVAIAQGWVAELPDRYQLADTVDVLAERFDVVGGRVPPAGPDGRHAGF